MGNIEDYMGDGVYAEFDGYSTVLTTDTGESVTNTIYLEPSVFTALKRFVEVYVPAKLAQRKIDDQAEPQVNDGVDS